MCSIHNNKIIHCLWNACKNVDSIKSWQQKTTNNAANIYDSTSFSRDFYLDLTGSDKTITFRVWSDEVKPGLLKLFHSIGGNGAIEKAFTTSGNGWETIELDFS